MKVLICGLLPKQERIIQAACPAGVDLRFVGVDQSPKAWGLRGKDCAYCVLVTGFISHKHVAALQKYGCTLVYFSGGTARLKDLIERIANGHDPQENHHGA